jgi:protein-arginine kinase activator protein McsA
MICERCHAQEAIIDWHSSGPAADPERHMWLCQACAEALTPPEIMQRIREAQARRDAGATDGLTISGFTSYTSPLNRDDKSQA